MSATKPGDLLVVYLAWENTGTATISDTAGDTFAAAAPATLSSGYSSQVFYARNTIAGSTSVTATLSISGVSDMYVAEYAGLDRINPLDKTAAASGNSASPNSGSITTTASNDLLFGAGAMNGGQPTTPGSGFTFRSTANWNVVEDRNVSSTGSYSASATLAAPGPWFMHIVAFKAAGARDPLQQPFASTSFWNMPIGSGATYAPANLPSDPRGDPWSTMPQNDPTHIIFTPSAPVTNIYYSDAAWTGKNRCAKTSNQVLLSVPLPSNYVVPNSLGNEGSTFLMQDGRTLNQAGPFTRCTAGGYATSTDTSTPLDLYGDGMSSSLGASGLGGSPGGVLRLGELRPGGQGPHHVLKFDVDTGQSLYKCTTDADCFRWPASSADNFAVGVYGAYNNNQNTQMKIGTLLAIPPTTNVNNMGLETDPGRQLAWTLQNYGAYIVDEAGAGCFSIVTEKGPNGWFGDLSEEDTGPPLASTQFYNDYGFAFEQRVNSNTPWSRDMQRLVSAVQAVTNNTSSTIGGGGTPRQPLAPPIGP
ncbi:hypothetical protein [Antrihabitans cavernicola]|uniref:Uncharacterized protein n=1 Tax=Antrihabitans cavernicola TaxID=2495913 RepID=A0A5A7SFG1_9NOCA|nr:hypothetical protein [Spelaeibacter cavernicola]KAA0024868.1 hypothetical protein FOY51_02775 [Spelaeibacter cavernicola]